jgi:hypothetical protein
MAVNGRKISSFNKLNELTGDEFLMVAFQGKSYKVPVSLLLGNVITELSQERNDGDGEDNPIIMRISDGTTKTFHVYNGRKGQKGDPGDQGPKGERGDSGIALYGQTSDEIRNLIVNSLDGANFSDEELTERMLSAAMGVILAKQVSELKEVYFDTQEEYDEALAAGKIYDDTKYYIFEE